MAWMKRAVVALMMVAFAGSLASCMGEEKREAIFKLPAGKRVVVFVDPRANQNVPPEFSSELGLKISTLLQQFGGADAIVQQSRVMELRRESGKFSKMSVADVAVASDADVVLHVDVIGFGIATISDQSITQGGAQAIVKVVDRHGKRLWPPETTTGAAVTAKVDPGFTEQRDARMVQRELNEQLGSRIARIFLTYKLGEPALSK
jgi:hypothetical protein